MRRWFKISPVRCRCCGHITITFSDILRDGAAFDDGTFECGKCLRNGAELRRLWSGAWRREGRFLTQ